VGAIYLLTAAIAGLSGIEAPTRSACIPAMVGVEDLPGAMVLNQVEYQVGGVVGPLLGGFLIASVSEASASWFDVATFVVALVFVVRLDPQIPSGGGTRPGLGSLAEGWRYLRGARDVQGTFVIDVNAMVFGMPRALFPEMARSTFGGGASVYGLLQAAPAAGAIVGAAGAGWVGRVDRQGRAVFIAVAVWGAALVLFGFSPWLWTALILLAIAGWADAISAIFRNTIMQLSVPDALRGRISAIHIAVVTGGPRLGDLESGGVATLTNVRVAAWTGGAACIAGCGLVARLWPELQAWRLSREGRAMAQGLSP
jgi:MFS family permease